MKEPAFCIYKLENHQLIVKFYSLKNLSILHKLRLLPAYGRETDKISFNLFVSGRIHFMSVSNPVNPLLVR